MVLGVQKVIDNKIDDLLKSDFRNSFKLSEKDIKYIKKNGMDRVRDDAIDIIKKRIASDVIFNDGKQTPTKGHPVFVAQHATGTCCRRCLYKCHGIMKGKRLSKSEFNYLILLIMTWIEREYSNYSE